MRTTPVDETPEAQPQIDAPRDAKPLDATGKSSRKSILALSVFALGLNAAAAVYTLSPSDFALPGVSRLAELLPLKKASDPVPDPVVTALNAIQTAQQQHVAVLQQNASSLQQNTALLQQDSTALSSLRKSITDEHVDVKKISAQITDEHADVKKMSAQISALTAKIDALQHAMAPEITSSIPPRRAQRLVLRKWTGRQPEPLGPVSIGGAPLNPPDARPATDGTQD
jgi:hypothetical protein